VLFLKDDPGPPEAAARTALNLHPESYKQKTLTARAREQSLCGLCE
jgi:hypothetical protein